MARYKVKALTISGAGKQVFRAGEVISDKDLVPGAGPKNVKSGHLILLEAQKAEPKAEAKAETKTDSKKQNPVDKLKKGKKK